MLLLDVWESAHASWANPTGTSLFHNWITGIAFSPDGNTLAISGADPYL
jgi:hypothetical protein